MILGKSEEHFELTALRWYILLTILWSYARTKHTTVLLKPCYVEYGHSLEGCRYYYRVKPESQAGIRISIIYLCIAASLPGLLPDLSTRLL
jgi:hypothetical protein